MATNRQKLGEQGASGHNSDGELKPLGDGVGFRQRIANFLRAPLFKAATIEESRSDLVQSHGALARVAEALVDGELLLPPDAQGLVEFAARLQNVGDLAHRDGALAHGAQALKSR